MKLAIHVFFSWSKVIITRGRRESKMGSGVPRTWVPADTHQISENLGTEEYRVPAKKFLGTDGYRVPAK